MERDDPRTDDLWSTAQAMVAEGKGILAADESTGTIAKRLASIGAENTEDNRRDYRELLFRSEGFERTISGVILFDETLRQRAADGTPLVELLTTAGVIPGIKVDEGAKPLAGAPDETVTEGLDGLRGRRRDADAVSRLRAGGKFPSDKKKAPKQERYPLQCEYPNMLVFGGLGTYLA